CRGRASRWIAIAARDAQRFRRGRAGKGSGSGTSRKGGARNPARYLRRAGGRAAAAVKAMGRAVAKKTRQRGPGQPRISLAGASLRKALAGKRILVTRARKQASQLSAKLRALGASVIEIP